MGRKRANGDGTIYRLPNGKWKAVVCLGRDPSGRLIRRSKIAHSHAAARTKLDELRDEPTGDTRRLTVSQYLERWLEDTVKPNLASNTYASYRQQVDMHISPRIGNLKLKVLGAIHIQEFLATMLRDDVPSATRAYVFRVLNNALIRADRLDLIASNPCGKVDPPRHRRKDIRPFTADEARLIIQDVIGEPLHAFYVVAFSTGMRQGELCGLQWEDVDERAGLLRIRNQLVYGTGTPHLSAPKTPHSIRTIELSPACLAALSDRKKWAMKNGLAGCKLVFSNSRGGAINPRNFNTFVWKPQLKRLELPHRGFHHVRHTYATLALGGGVPINVVSNVLGHSNAATTLKLYAHALPSQQQQSTAAVAKLIG